MLERFDFFFGSTVSLVVQFNGTISYLVQRTRDLEIQGHATLTGDLCYLRHYTC